MPADWPDESDGPPDRSDSPLDGSDGHPDRRDDNSAATHPTRPTHPEPEPPSRQDAYVSLRLAVSTEQTSAAHQTTATEHAAAQKWSKDAQESRWMWSEYERRWPPEDRPPPSRLKPSEALRVEAACDSIAERERDKISPAMRAIESLDSDRHLVGFDNRLKSQDRIEEKVHRDIRNRGRSPEQAISLVPDALRYTFQYRESRYTEGVWSDIGRLKEQGFEMLKLRNSWTNDQYKGINSQWIDPDTGQRFEVQFHSRISFEAKELTHKAYERLRTHQPDGPDKFEQMVLRAFQKNVGENVPVPLGATDIPDYP